MLHKLKNNKAILFFKQRYNRVLEVNNFKVQFNDRNDTKVVIPFLNGIGAEFNMIDNCVMVNDSQNVVTKLKELKFEQLGNVIDQYSMDRKDSIFRSIIKGACRYYNHEYNIEIYIIQNCHWNSLNTASVISHNLIQGKVVTDTFLSVYNSLLFLEQKG